MKHSLENFEQNLTGMWNECNLYGNLKSINSLALSFLYDPTLTSMHDYWMCRVWMTTQTFVGKVMSLLFKALSRFDIAILWSIAWRILSKILLACEMSVICMVIWKFFGTALLWYWNENRPFPVLWSSWVFQICWHNECSTLAAASFKIWNSSTGIWNSPLHGK